MPVTVSRCSQQSAEVVEIVDDSLARLQHLAQVNLARVAAWLGSPILVHWQPISALVDGELPEVIVAPPHGCLDNVVQPLERDRGGHLDLAPNHRIAATQLDEHGGDLVYAVGCGAVPSGVPIGPQSGLRAGPGRAFLEPGLDGRHTGRDDPGGSSRELVQAGRRDPRNGPDNEYLHLSIAGRGEGRRSLSITTSAQLRCKFTMIREK